MLPAPPLPSPGALQADELEAPADLGQGRLHASARGRDTDTELIRQLTQLLSLEEALAQHARGFRRRPLEQPEREPNMGLCGPLDRAEPVGARLLLEQPLLSLPPPLVGHPLVAQYAPKPSQERVLDLLPDRYAEPIEPLEGGQERVLEDILRILPLQSGRVGLLEPEALHPLDRMPGDRSPALFDRRLVFPLDPCVS